MIKVKKNPCVMGYFIKKDRLYCNRCKEELGARLSEHHEDWILDVWAEHECYFCEKSESAKQFKKERESLRDELREVYKDFVEQEKK